MGKFRPSFLSAIDSCLKVRHLQRPRSVAELRPMLLEKEKDRGLKSARRGTQVAEHTPIAVAYENAAGRHAGKLCRSMVDFSSPSPRHLRRSLWRLSVYAGSTYRAEQTDIEEKRQAELDAQKRQKEAEEKRQAELEAEKRRKQADEVIKRQASLDVEKRRMAEIDAERARRSETYSRTAKSALTWFRFRPENY